MKNPEQVIMETIEELDHKYSGRIMVTELLMEQIRTELFAQLDKKQARKEFDPLMYWEKPPHGIVKLLPGWKERVHLVADGDKLEVVVKAIMPLYANIKPLPDLSGKQTYRIEVRTDFYGTLREAETEAAKIADFCAGEVTAIWDENWEEC